MTESDRVIEGRWKDAVNVRFVRGRPQKVGGWVSAVAEKTDGVPRAIHAWRDTSFQKYLAAGTYKKLYVYDSEFLQSDVTPYRSTGSLSGPFTTTNGSATITVTHSGHGLSVGDIIIFSGASAVGGLTLDGTFSVSEVTDSNTYKFIFTASATSGATGGGTVSYKYELPIGVELGAYGYGWGVGGWGTGTWGTARGTSTIGIEPRVWSLDHYGKLLIAAYNGGSIYKFDPTASQPWGRAELLSSDASLPDNVRAMLVTPEGFVFALLDTMQVQWCSQYDTDTWTPADNNSANIRTLTHGTKLVSGRVLADFVTLVWSDAALYRFQYTGSRYVYNSSLAGVDCGLYAPGAAVTANGIAYWMGHDTFWMYNGSVVRIPNVEDIREYVFNGIDRDMSFQAAACYVPQFNEIQFFFTQSGNTNPNAGVAYSIDDQCWRPIYHGRTSSTHFTQGDTRPYLGYEDGTIYQHEVGSDADGEVLPWSITLAPYAMNEGLYRMDLEDVVVDIKDQVGTIDVTLTTWDRLTDSSIEDQDSGEYAAVDGDTVNLRVSGRYLGLTLSCSELGSNFRLGKPVALVRKSGERN